MPTPTAFLLFMVAFLAAGCGRRFSGEFVFTNQSTNGLWVEITGFERNPPCGALIPGAHAGASMNPMPLPAQFTISWSDRGSSWTSSENLTRSNISLAGLPPIPRGTRIACDFTPDLTWKLRHEQSP